MLAQNPDVQNKLRTEIREARKDGDVSLDTLIALPYLEAVCRETLRVFVISSHMFCFTKINSRSDSFSVIHLYRKLLGCRF
jgi:cytochrome P450